MKKPGLLSRDYVRITQPHFAVTLPATVEGFYRAYRQGPEEPEMAGQETDQSFFRCGKKFIVTVK